MKFRKQIFLVLYLYTFKREVLYKSSLPWALMLLYHSHVRQCCFLEKQHNVYNRPSPCCTSTHITKITTNTLKRGYMLCTETYKLHLFKQITSHYILSIFFFNTTLFLLKGCGNKVPTWSVLPQVPVKCCCKLILTPTDKLFPMS